MQLKKHLRNDSNATLINGKRLQKNSQLILKARYLVPIVIKDIK